MALKRALRPLVTAARDALREVQKRRLSCPEWDGVHHPSLAAIEPWRGLSDGTRSYDFLGGRTDPKFRAQFSPDPEGPVAPPLPVPSAPYFEWIALFEAIGAAEGSFTMAELGAGYGPWLAAAWLACRRARIDEVTLIGVEMDPQLFGWLGEHLADNGVPPDTVRLLNRAVSDRSGEGRFSAETDPRNRYGQRFESGRAAGAHRSVRSSRLEEILDRGRTDFLHSDVQGAEGAIFPDSVELLRRRVRSVAVSTHGRAIHRSVRAALDAAGFECDYDFAGRGWRATPFGKAYFLDGLIVARNPELHP